MIGIAKYLEFVNESNSNKIDVDKEFIHFSGGPLQSWESGLRDKIGEILNMNDNFLGDRLNNLNSMRYNIKIYDQPNFNEIAEERGETTEEIYESWNNFLSDRLSFFCEDMVEKYSWITGWEVEGRQGGWLIVKTEINDLRDELHDLCRDYRFTKEDIIFPLDLQTAKDIEQYFSDPNFWDFMADVPPILTELNPSSLEKVLDGVVGECKRICDEILELEDYIKKSKATAHSDFIKEPNWGFNEK